ncbi:MAG TPA: LL-diaminopimelate aminotransferase [Anaerolineaceae bacterium]|jgi:LL-diaminopimelate aminotransferase|nr:LL-diaminopimelate aminotransferase [Longilinea sp.]HNZ14348.1 LL-diaminopimelate aminotransferase [Anaerolineaceae bacterium]
MTTQTSFIRPADRIASFKPYFFASLVQKINGLKASGMDVIRIDMGSPDLPPADFIVDALEKSARKANTHGYSPNGGTPAFREAIANYYKTRFNVDLDPKSETLQLIGSKEGLFNLSEVLLNPGDVSLVPDPGYPVYSASGIIAGAEVVYLPLNRETGFLPDLDAIPEETARRAKILWLNYPNNPTGAIAPMAFLEKAVAFAKKYEIVLAHDAPYTDVCFDGYRAPSILEIPGAKDVAVEFNSLSKTYNMAGWRLGMAVGNAQVINYLHTFKSQVDSSQFQPILDAGIAALAGDQSWLEERNEIYQHRRDVVLQGLRAAGFTVDTPPAAIYVWAQLPAGEKDSITFCNRLLEETGVSTTPGIVYGQHGEGYLRISLGTATHRIEEAMERITRWVKAKK